MLASASVSVSALGEESTMLGGSKNSTGARAGMATGRGVGRDGVTGEVDAGLVVVDIEGTG